MSENFAKDPLNPSHGDSLVGQNFQSLKSKEVRDSASPISDLKFHSMTLNHPNTTGWDVQTSSEVSPDGRAYRTETTATTDGVEKINGGTAEFRGRNEQRASASHQGDDKNFVKKASESSNTQLQEHVVVGDENSGRSEMKMSSTTTSSSSQVTSSSSTVEYGGGEQPIDARYLVDNPNRQHADPAHQQQRLTEEQYIQQQKQRQQQLAQQEFEQTKQYQQQQQQQHQQRVQQQQQEQRQFTEEFNRSRQESSTSRNVETQQKTEQNRRIVDVDKASPEYQQHVQYLMAQPGEIISNTVEYPKPNVKMITTVKRLPDGTIVKNKRYETEESQPTVESQRQRTTSSTSQNSTQQRNQQRREQTDENLYNRQQNVRSNVQPNSAPRRPENDVVDSGAPFVGTPGQQQHLVESRPTERFTDEVSNVETKFSSVKKSSRRFSTETTSETIEEFADQVPSSNVPGVHGKPSGRSPAPDFSTHGFPSVRSNKPTQEYPSDRPRPSDVEHLTQQTVTELHKSTADAPHGFPAVRPNSNITTTKDGDVVIVSSESTRSSKYKTNAERVIETEVVIDDDFGGRPQPNRGFPAVKGAAPGATSPRYDTPTREYPPSGFPSVRSPTKQSQPVPYSGQDGNVTVVSSETKKTVKHNTNREHIIETEVVGDNERYTPAGLRQPDKITFPPTPQPADFSTHGFPSVKDSSPTSDAYRRQGTPTRDYPSSPRQAQPSADFSTHGFPSVRTPSKAVPDYSVPSGGFPATRDTNAPKLTPTQTRPQSTPQKSTTTTDSSQRLISKERDVDATHRAFAASLRCSSPVDSTDHHRGTPRSSVSSTRTFRRDGREGSHDSETSRISSGTVTRSTPSKSVGKTVVTKQNVVKTRNVNGSNETIDLTPQRHTKSPSPNKSVTTTTTTRITTTRKSPGEVPKSDNQKPKPAENTFPIINEPLTITKTHFTTNDANILGNEVVEKPCLKKHFYKLGPSDRATTNNVDERSPYSPAPSNHIVHRTHPKTKSPIRDDLADANHEEPIHNKPSISSSVIEPKQRNRSPSGQPKSSSPQTICQPLKKEPSVERRTVVSESTFENTDWHNTILDTDEKQYPVKGNIPKYTEKQPTNVKQPNDEYIETIRTKSSPIDTSDYPVTRSESIKQPSSKTTTEFITKTTTKLVANNVTEGPEKPENTKPKKTLVSIDKNSPKEGKPTEPLSRKINDKPTTQPAGKAPVERKPNNKETSPTRRSSDVKTSRIFATTKILKTTADDENETKKTVTDKPTYRKSNQTEIRKPNDVEHSPDRKTSDTTITVKTTRKQTTQRADASNQPDEPAGRKPRGETPTDYKKPINNRPIREESETLRSTLKTSRIDKTYALEDNYLPDEPERGQPALKKPFDRKKSSDNRPTETQFPKRNHSPTRTTTDINKLKSNSTTIKTRTNNVSPTRKFGDIENVEPVPKKSTSKKPTELFGTQPKDVKPEKPAPRRVNEPEQSDDEEVPTDRRPAKKPTTNAYEPLPNNSDKNGLPLAPSTQDDSSTFITTTIKTVRVDEPQITQNIDDETKRVEELFNKTNKAKITKEVNEEFISFERQVDETVDERRKKKPTNPDYGKPYEPFNNADIPKSSKDTVTTKTTFFEETENIDFDERNTKKKPEPVYNVHQAYTDTNKSKMNTVTTSFKASSKDTPYTPVELPKSYEPKSKKPSIPSQPENEQPDVLQPTDVNSSDDEASTQQTYETSTTIKDIRLTTANDERTGTSGPKKPTKPEDRTFEPRGKPYPVNREQPDVPFDEPSDETKRVEELFKTTNKIKTSKNYNEEFIAIEGKNKETPDGAFISKAPEPEPSSPSFKKKGVSPRETFEDRCRQILGMENYGDTPGSYKPKPDDTTEQTEPLPENNTMFEVKLEDCEDDEPNYLNNIKEAIKPLDKPKTYKPYEISDEELVEEVECVRRETVVPFKRGTPEREPKNETTSKSTRVVQKDIDAVDDEQIIQKTTTKVVKKVTTPLPKEEQLEDVEPEVFSSTDEESQPDTVVSDREGKYLYELNIEKSTEKNQISKPTKKPSNTSPTRKPTEPVTGGKKSPLKQYPSDSSTRTTTTTTTTTHTESKPKTREPKTLNGTKPIAKSPERPAKKDKLVAQPKTGSSPKTFEPHKESPSSTIKDRLRSATRNKKTSITETDSSPDISPTRFTERRRSSNISVHTEIIIDHSGPKSPKSKEKITEPQPRKPLPTDTVSSPKPFRKLPVTERKESAPVPSVARKDKDVKMTRSTSEKIIKVTEKPAKKPELSSLAPSASPKSERRPNKCFTTKTINLSATDKLINIHDMENVIIDIQHAKSSREPSPDKIVPTPVPVHLDTGKPRYPDVVQEPEDEPRKKPIIKNIPIFEEESNEFVNCHISEVKTEKITKLIDLEEDDILDNPTIEAPLSLDYPSIDKPDDDCLMSVHEKVSKFTHTAEEIKKPKASSPFSREFDKTPKVPENDDCLLTVDEKVNKFIKTAEDVTKPITTPVRDIERPNFTDLDEELRQDDCTLTVSQKVNKFLSTAEKLAPTAPQRSPELVAKIERTISKQSEPEYPEGVSDDELMPFSQNHTIEIEKRRQKDILSRPTVFENSTSTNRNATYADEEVTIIRSTTSEPENDEVIPHTRDHTTKIELKRQKDILSRPSIYDKSPKPRPQSPNKKEPTVSSMPQQLTSSKTKQTEYSIKQTNAVEREKIVTKGERKPSTTTTKPEVHKSPTKPQTSTVAVTRSRFEIADKKKSTPKSPTEPKTTRVPLPNTTARKQSAEPKIPAQSVSGRPVTNTTYSNRRKPSTEPERQSPQTPTRKQSTEPDCHSPGRKQSKESVINGNDYQTIESEAEFTSTTRRRSSSKTKDYLETVQTEIERFSPIQKEPTRKIPLQENQKPYSNSFSHSPTRKATASTNKVTQLTERTIQHYSPSESSDIEIVETILERPAQVKTPIPTPTTVGRSRIVPDTVAARRNIFENGTTPQKPQKTSGTSSPSPIGRRPSYMDHTVSSLEHQRRDSLEVNKQNYSRKSSVESDGNYERRPNAAVKFDVPHKPQRTTSIPDDIDIESIFELEVLEGLLETVTSYELRRRIRAQIRLVKKNILNTEVVDKRKTETKSSKSISSTHKTSSTYTSNVHHEETDNIEENLKTKRPYESKPSPKRTTQPTPTKNVRVIENADMPMKSPHGRDESPKRYGKLRHDEEVTIKLTTSAQVPNGRSDSPKRTTKSPRERQHSPETKSPQGSVKGVSQTTGYTQSTHKEFIRNEQRDYSEERFNSSRRVEQNSERFENEKEQSRERSYSPETKSPVSGRKQSAELKTKTAPGPRTKSPEAGKSTFQRPSSPKGRTPKQRDDLYSASKVTTIKTTRSPERKTSKPTADENVPIWADRKTLLKSPTSTPRKVTQATPSTRTTATKTTTSKSTSQRQTQSKNFEEDSITSSYGIGPTDENGLPLFGIKALKKKKPSQPCEATEEVTGYVIEEKYYSDNKTKPKVERKEYIYSTNADELEEIKKTVKQSRKSSQDDVDVIRRFEKIDKDHVFENPEAIMPDSEEFNTSSKYVRRGSVKELSEKFIRKESSQSITDKSGGYPKAGLILRTSRGPSADPFGDSYETTTEKYTTSSRSGHEYRSVEGDSDDEDSVQLRQKQTTRRLFTGSDDNESDQCHLSTRSSTKSTRSFLNSSGESKVVTSVDDALERMRNADYVVEAGDTAEDREARSLLNKFLGASVIMRGVESVLPSTNQTTTTTITKTSYADDDDDSDLLKNKAVKTTRITKTTKSGSSSTPVTRTTCDIEEIWDEEILKELLEQATTYEERRKIRARLRDLMAEREEQQATSTTEKTETKEKDGAVVTTTTKVTTRTVTGSGNTASKPVSPFAKFRQLDKQNSQQSPKSPSTPTTPGGTASPSGSARIFQFTDPALNARAATVKDQLLQWCQSKTQEYENVQITNFSASWSDGLAFCALIHHFLPDAFDYSTLTPKSRRRNFELAFTVADEKAGIAPLLDVEDMVEMKRPDWKCVFIYVQSIYRRFRNCQ